MKFYNIFQNILKLLTLSILVTSIVAATKLYHSHNALSITLIVMSVIGFVFLIFETFHFKSNTKKAVIKLSSQIAHTEHDSLLDFPAPVIIIDSDESIIWYNKIFGNEVYPDNDIYGVKVSDMVNIDMQKVFTPNGDLVCIEKKFYRAKSIATQSEDSLFMIYFENVTDYVELDYQTRQSHESVIIICIDNYDDLWTDLRESEKAHALVEIEKLIENFIDGTTGVSKKMSSDKFWIVLEERYLSKIINNRFKILEEARKISVGEKKKVTLSIGVGSNSKNLAESELYAKQALDMCLGRGGDQAAVKTESGYKFFGGVSNGVEKHTKVKTRMVTSALIELLNTHSNVLIMGHKHGDLDSVGAATGMCCALRKMGKDASVVINFEDNLAKPLIQYIQDNDINHYYITPEDGLKKVDEDTLVIVVDTHNPDLVESVDILNKTNQLVVIDHHRLAVKCIENALIFYHEPIASSTCEMVAEIIEYFGSNAKISSPVACAMLAGITLDTKSFILRTGIRTFEAAAFLKRMGADTVDVKKLFSNSFEVYQEKSTIINTAEIYHKCAISSTEEEYTDIRIAASQAADELLGITGVNASFVLFINEGKVNISARSLGTYNVQIIMETLGGGGHLTMAATQLDTDMEDAKKQLKEAINQYIIDNVK
ncbi:MAG: DHH family phosphoesterase [Oscillospiraceae bacterium]